ncbi:hypothetical protein AB0G04_40190 [Actinoplanes sp. NPDC023801]|uniref:hypothetical protein n=1 Tax=Actinoplanes sp. NPDC023801 TaxID=3154595 RepID=UPI0033C5887C
MSLFHAEIIKIRVTRSSWLLGAAGAAFWLVSLMLARLQASQIDATDVPVDQRLSASELAVELYTAGTISGATFMMLFGIVCMSSEFQHRTASLTFLASPRRVRVVRAKWGAVALVGLLSWAVATLMNFLLGVWPSAGRLGGLLLSDPGVQRAVVASMVAYVLWGGIGVGFGVLVRSQVLASTIALALTFGGTLVISSLVLLTDVFGGWMGEAVTVFPTLATLLMMSPPGQDGLQPWVGAAILIGWAAGTTVAGTYALTRRDIP